LRLPGEIVSPAAQQRLLASLDNGKTTLKDYLFSRLDAENATVERPRIELECDSRGAPETSEPKLLIRGVRCASAAFCPHPGVPRGDSPHLYQLTESSIYAAGIDVVDRLAHVPRIEAVDILARRAGLGMKDEWTKPVRRSEVAKVIPRRTVCFREPGRRHGERQARTPAWRRSSKPDRRKTAKQGLEKSRSRCVYRQLKRGRGGDEVRPGWRAN
jgi:hypothetical protein